MKKSLGVIIGKRDATEGTIYYTKVCDYLVLKENGKYVVEGRPTDKEMLGLLNFISENEDSFLLGRYYSEKEVFEAIADFEISYLNNKKIK